VSQLHNSVAGRMTWIGRSRRSCTKRDIALPRKATKAGALQNSRLIIVVAEAAEKIHVEEIIRKLDALVPSAALSSKQAILGNSPRPSSGLPACRA